VEGTIGTKVDIVKTIEPDVSVVTKDVRGMISMLDSEGIGMELAVWLKSMLGLPLAAAVGFRR